MNENLANGVQVNSMDELWIVENPDSVENYKHNLPEVIPNPFVGISGDHIDSQDLICLDNSGMKIDDINFSESLVDDDARPTGDLKARAEDWPSDSEDIDADLLSAIVPIPRNILGRSRGQRRSTTRALPKKSGRKKSVSAKKIDSAFRVEESHRKQNTVKPLSMSRNAVDFRNRKTMALEYRKRLVDLLDDDIKAQVQREGGITPDGRLFKAVLLDLQRHKGQATSRRDLVNRSLHCGKDSPENTHTMAKNLQDKCRVLEEKMAKIQKLAAL